MKIDDLYPSRFLKASDLHDKPGKAILVTIEGLNVEEFDDGETKPALLLKGSKPLILNRTNAGLIGTFLGEDTDGWRDKRIVLFVAKVDFRGRLVDSIRVREPRGPAQTPTPAASPKPPEPGPEDDVPF